MCVMGIAGLFTIVTSLACFFTTKERYIAPPAEHSSFTQLKKLLRVKGIVPSVIIWLTGYFGYSIMMGSSVYYVLYVICRPDLIAPYMLTVSICGLFGVTFCIPVFMRIFKFLCLPGGNPCLQPALHLCRKKSSPGLCLFWPVLPFCNPLYGLRRTLYDGNVRCSLLRDWRYDEWNGCSP